eukprot:TRINITY_DN3502_c0_g1_i1.p1 TRINITY_DN3502_c0_g1~~TRINITY_DN3502_c0_g1_i1.p1  ORF type:complete len:176 (-),score=30.76 TRINITY_DN3502_c0_g1_i1:578-1105(-)
MVQPPTSNPPDVASAPPPAAYGGNYAEAKQYAADATSPYGQKYPPQATPVVAQGQPAYCTPQAQAYYPAAQPVPGGGTYPPQQPSAFHVVQAPPQYPDRDEGCCVTPDWIFFGIGWIVGISWVIGALLPLCRTPKFANSTVRGGWIANCIMTILFIVAIVIIIVNRPSSGDDSYY